MCIRDRAYTTYRSIQLHTVLLAEYFIEIMAIIVIVKQAVSRYTYILTDTKLIIEESSFFRKRHFEVDYDTVSYTHLDVYKRQHSQHLSKCYKKKINSIIVI